MLNLLLKILKHFLFPAIFELFTLYNLIFFVLIQLKNK